MGQQPAVDKIYLYVKDPSETKYEFVINNRESKSLKHFNDSKAFTEYFNNIDDI